MRDFTSASLQRDFDRIIFASAIRVGTNPVTAAAAAAPAALPAGHPSIAGAQPGADALPAGHPPVGRAPHGDVSAALQGGGAMIRGEVIETMDAAGYTYVQVKTADGDVWAAANRMAVSKGDRVEFASGMIMQDFESPTLKRRFAKIHFVESIRKEGAPPAERPAGHP